MIFFAGLVCACHAFSLLQQPPHSKLHNMEPWMYREWANVAIDSDASWSKLATPCRSRSGHVMLVELKSLCFVPTAETLARVATEFILFGPFYDSHHVNFGPLSELAHPSGQYLFEARVTNKLKDCERRVTLEDIQRLIAHRTLRWWIVHQHVHEALYSTKLRVLPLGFGYHAYRAMSDMTLREWRDIALETLQKQTAPRDNLLLTSFSIHTNMFGDQGNDARSELLRNLSRIPSLERYAQRVKFAGPREFAAAMATSMFVLSPWGWGPDCFRHYEAVALGCIPIMLSDWAANHAVDGLPVLIVHEWLELNSEMLHAAYARIHAKKYDLSPLMRDYWHGKLFWINSNATHVCE
jgi:hypothetical protein